MSAPRSDRKKFSGGRAHGWQWLAVVIGLAGGFGPAWRAARMRPIEALRKG